MAHSLVHLDPVRPCLSMTRPTFPLPLCQFHVSCQAARTLCLGVSQSVPWLPLHGHVTTMPRCMTPNRIAPAASSTSSSVFHVLWFSSTSVSLVSLLLSTYSYGGAMYSCCCLREDAVNGQSYDGTAIAISHFLFSPLDQRIHLGPPRSPILCHFHTFCANTLCHCLLSSPHPEPTSMTLRSQLFLQISQPFHMFQHKDANRFTLWINFCQTCHMTAPREVTSEAHFTM